MRRTDYPVTLGLKQLQRIGEALHRTPIGGFRIALGGCTYYFIRYHSGAIGAYEYIATLTDPTLRLRPAEAYLSCICIAGFKRAYNYMVKRGWL